jgi:hypothetical protein
MVLLSELGLQIATVADLGDYVTIAIGGENLVTLEDVGMAQFF